MQKHGTGPVDVTLRAGEGDGPWWVAIQRGFGPLYLEQLDSKQLTRYLVRRLERLGHQVILKEPDPAELVGAGEARSP